MLEIPTEFSLRNSKEREHLGDLDDDIKLDLKEIVWKAMYLIHVAHDRTGSSDNVIEYSGWIDFG
jgi:hypothetical protein